MKILFENYALTSVITSLYTSANYSPYNLVHIFLRKRYQNTAGVDTLTFMMPADKSVNCFYFGYHNALEAYRLTEDGEERVTEDGYTRSISSAGMTITLKDYLGNTLYTETMLLIEQFYALHFDTVEGVRSIEVSIDWTGVGAGYLGGVGFGMDYTMPDPIANWQDGALDNSIVGESLTGQVTQTRIEPLIDRTFNFAHVTREQYAAIKDYINAVGNGRPFWIDCFEGAQDLMIPMYARIMGGIQSPAREDKKYSFTLNFREAR
jgi:hypothetical protein